MNPRWLSICFASIICFVLGAEEATPKPRKPCTIKSGMGFDFDLSGLSVLPKQEGQKVKKDARDKSWMALGYDSNVNYTINICAPVIEDVKDVEGFSRSEAHNMSAFYVSGGKTYSLGELNTELVFRGKKLVLNYTGGSPCEEGTHPVTSSVTPSVTPRSDSKNIRRKSMMISFLCNEESDSKAPKVALSFVGASPDYCHYGFEARSPLACAGSIPPQEQAVGPGSLFGIILLIAIGAYIFGGIAYQRNVMHQRGWRQFPNYSMWAGIVSFFRDMFIILFSSCTRCIPKRRGYNQLPAHSGRGRGSSRDDENRLIDQLDEEWED